MESSPRVSPPEPLCQAGEAATPGASVAAHQGDRQTSALDTPGPPSPGHTSPTPHRSQEEGRSVSRGRGSAGLEAAAAAGMDGRGDPAAAAAAPAPPAAAEPLSRPRLRVQGADIILEDASSPKAATAPAANGVPAAAPQRSSTPAAARPADPLGPALQPASRAPHGSPGAAAAQPPPPHTQHSGPFHGSGVRSAQSHEHELALRLASRTATGVSNVAMASSKPHIALPHGDERWVPPLARAAVGPARHVPGGPAFRPARPSLSSCGCCSCAAAIHHASRAPLLPFSPACRARGNDTGGGGEAGPSGGSSVEGPVRVKYRSSLTEENVAYLNKLDQYSSRPESSGAALQPASACPPALPGRRAAVHAQAGKHAVVSCVFRGARTLPTAVDPAAERIWRWLEGSGPPFDNPPPSLGVPPVSKGTHAAASKRPAGTRRGLFSCFSCFGGRQ
jgi:hypothetical protein